MVTEKNSDSDFKTSFLAAEEGIKAISSGDVVNGYVIQVTPEEVIVDVGLKGEGRIRRAEFEALGEKVAVGDTVQVKILSLEQEDGGARISRQRAVQDGRWNIVQDAFANQQTVRGRIVEEVKGGFKVDIGLAFGGFLPRSQATLNRKFEAAELIGQEFDFEIKELNRRRKNIVLSRRGLLEKEVRTIRDATLQKVKVGEIVDGVVKNITNFGVFVDIGGIDGLIMLGDLSWGGFVKDASKIVKKNEEVKVKILEYDATQAPPRIRLGLKQVQGEPWQNLPANVKPGATIEGVVKSFTNFGAFIEIIPGVDGLAHISELSWTSHVKHPSEVLELGAKIAVKVVSVDASSRKISLSIKDTMPDPWSQVLDEYPPGTRIRGTVTGVTNFGAFVRLPSGIEGMIHRSDLSWDEEKDDPAEIVKVGDEIDAIVLQVDSEQKKISLGLKQTLPDPWQNVMRKYQKNHIIEAPVSKIAAEGVYLALEGDVTGFISKSELPRAGEETGEALEEGKTVRAKVTKLERKGKKVLLSLRELIKQEEAANLKDYMTEQKSQTGTITLGDLVSDPEMAQRLKDMVAGSEK